MNLYDKDVFTKWQMEQIRIGLEQGVDVSIYADPRFEWEQMRQIREGLKQGVDVSIYADPAFRSSQMYEIREGLEQNVDVSVYANPKFMGEQMEQIRKGLKQGVDVSIYTNPDFNPGQMINIRLGLEQGVDVSIYARPEFESVQMAAILEGLEKGVDASIYANPKFSAWEMQKFCESLIKEMNAGDLSTEEIITASRLFVDMDGTLSKFKPVDTLETLYEEGYFRNLEPLQNVVDAIKEIKKQYPQLQIYIMSSVLADSNYALIEKNEWLDKYLPEIGIEHRIFPPCGANKLDYIPDGIRITDYLLDDYTHNLSQWEPPAKGIKLLNGINHTNKTWQGNMLWYDKKPKELAQNIIDIISKKAMIQDVQPQNPEKRNEIHKRKLEAKGPKL